jgi:hypothetical protein
LAKERDAMNTYKPKSLIDGYKVDHKFTGMFLIAPNTKKLTEDCKIIFQDEIMVIKKGDKPLMVSKEFSNKFGAGTYKLAYFEWNPDKVKQVTFGF